MQQPWLDRPPVNTGPLEARDFGPTGRRLGTFADCYEDSPWELHRGELVEQMGSKDLHGITMGLATALFRAHARAGHEVLTDVYCDLSDDQGPSLRAPDVTLVGDLVPRDSVYVGKPIVAVEVRGTQSKRYLQEKVQLFLEHDWPLIWVCHVTRFRLEVYEAGKAPVTLEPDMALPLPAALDAHGLRGVPAACLFDSSVALRYVSEHLVEEGKKLGLDEGKKLGLDEGKKLGLIVSIEDVSELLGVPLDEQRRAHLRSLDVDELEALRLRLKRDRRW